MAGGAPSDASAGATAGASESVLPVSARFGARRAPLWFLGVITLVSLVADLWSKSWAMNHFDALQRGAPRQLVLIDGYLSLIYAKNRGGAWGLLQNENESLRRPFFLIVSVVAIVFIVSLYRKLSPGQTALKWGLPLVLGGALGNLIDRIRYGFVVDFIDAYATWGGEVRHWPTFNVADIAICVGVGLMAIDMFTPRRTRHAVLLAPAHPAPVGPAAPSPTERSAATSDDATRGGAAVAPGPGASAVAAAAGAAVAGPSIAVGGVEGVGEDGTAPSGGASPV